jgi:hypothetical protein
MRARRFSSLTVAAALLAGVATAAWMNGGRVPQPRPATADLAVTGFRGGDPRIRWVDLEVSASALFESQGSIYTVAFDTNGMTLRRVETTGALAPVVAVPFAVIYGGNVAAGDSGAGIHEARALVAEIAGRTAIAYGREVVLVSLPKGSYERFIFEAPARGVEDAISGLAVDGPSLLVTRDGVKSLAVLGLERGISLRREIPLPSDFPSPQGGVQVVRAGLAVVSAPGARAGEVPGSVAIDLSSGNVVQRLKAPLTAVATTNRGPVFAGGGPPGEGAAVAAKLGIVVAETRLPIAGPFAHVTGSGPELWFAGGVNAGELMVERGAAIDRYILPEYHTVESDPECRFAEKQPEAGCPVFPVVRRPGVFALKARPGGGALVILNPGTRIGIIDP